MYLLAGVLPVAVAIVVILHLIIFRHKKPFWINWAVLIGVSGGLIALLGAGALHAGLIGLLTFVIGFFWLQIWKDVMKRKREDSNQPNL